MNRIKLLREEKKIKQIELCEILNTTQATLSNWERGVHDPDNNSLIKMAEYFNTTTDYILGLTGNPKSTNKKEIAPSAETEREKRNIYFYDIINSLDIESLAKVEDYIDLLILKQNQEGGNKK